MNPFGRQCALVSRAKESRLKKTLLLALLAGMFAMAQEKVADTSASVSSVNYSPAQVKVLGAVEYGQTRTAASYVPGPRYRAFVFSGYGGDQVEIVFKGPARMPLVLADSTLNQVATGVSRICVALPNKGPDIEVWYVLTENSREQITLQVKKIGHLNAPLEARASGPAADVPSL